MGTWVVCRWAVVLLGLSLPSVPDGPLELSRVRLSSLQFQST